MSFEGSKKKHFRVRKGDMQGGIMGRDKDSQHDKIESVRLELFCAVNVGETEDITGRFYSEVFHQLLLAHSLQPF